MSMVYMSAVSVFILLVGLDFAKVFVFHNSNCTQSQRLLSAEPDKFKAAVFSLSL